MRKGVLILYKCQTSVVIRIKKNNNKMKSFLFILPLPFLSYHHMLQLGGPIFQYLLTDLLGH